MVENDRFPEIEIEKALENTQKDFLKKSKSRERNGSSSKLFQSRRLGFWWIRNWFTWLRW